MHVSCMAPCMMCTCHMYATFTYHAHTMYTCMHTWEMCAYMHTPCTHVCTHEKCSMYACIHYALACTMHHASCTHAPCKCTPCMVHALMHEQHVTQAIKDYMHHTCVQYTRTMYAYMSHAYTMHGAHMHMHATFNYHALNMQICILSAWCTHAHACNICMNTPSM